MHSFRLVLRKRPKSGDLGYAHKDECDGSSHRRRRRPREHRKVLEGVVRALDEAGAAKLDHREIVAWLAEKHDVGGWWRQMVAVSYEQARGLRAVHEKPGGFEISVSRTVADRRSSTSSRHGPTRAARSGWLPDARVHDSQVDRGEVASLRLGRRQERRRTPPSAQGRRGSAAVNVQHAKLPSAAAAKRMKDYWATVLDALKQRLEGRRGPAAASIGRSRTPMDPEEFETASARDTRRSQSGRKGNFRTRSDGKAQSASAIATTSSTGSIRRRSDGSSAWGTRCRWVSRRKAGGSSMWDAVQASILGWRPATSGARGG